MTTRHNVITEQSLACHHTCCILHDNPITQTNLRDGSFCMNANLQPSQPVQPSRIKRTSTLVGEYVRGSMVILGWSLIAAAALAIAFVVFGALWWFVCLAAKGLGLWNGS